MKMNIKLWHPIPNARARGRVMIILPKNLKGLKRIRRSRRNSQVMNASLATRWDKSA